MNSHQFRSRPGFSAEASSQKVAVKKFDLIGDHSLMGRPVIDVEMIDPWIDAKLTFRGLTCGFDGRPRLGHLIIRGDANQP